MKPLLLSCIAAAVAIASVDPTARTRQVNTGTQPRFAARSELVVLHVTVKDRRGAYVTGLPEHAFQVFDEGRAEPIAFFTGEDAPVTVGLIVDNSGSMRQAREQVLTAVRAFVEAGHPEDEVFALTFNEHVRPALAPEAPFTNDAEALRAALTSVLTARGRTALFDALAEGLAYVQRGRHPRQVLVVIGDGGDNASDIAFESVLRRAQASNATIYAVGFVDPLDSESDPGVLRRLSEATGGEAFFPVASRIQEVLGRIARDIRHTYTIGYVPRTADAPSLRRLRVTVTPPDRRRVEVRTRTSYLAGDDRW
jgi:VWFA-related protein